MGKLHKSKGKQDFRVLKQKLLYNKIDTKASHFSLMFFPACGMLKKGA